MKEGDSLPQLELHDAAGAPFRLAVAKGARGLAVYFYPKDDTAGCTREAQAFGALLPDFAAIGVEVIGVSKDPPERHRRFIDKHALAVRLASDDGSACEAFGVWGDKQLYGRTYQGIERATFLFDAAGVLVRQWRRVRVAGHAEAVLAAARALPAHDDR